ncbi:Aste57867_17223 [Aphanomyces stellatus]|uniref:Aste57867_17223 protein n=1 Tax=Aphanomyces stellatus TaxID=120398 RepID=A0A485L795_9STRA|nr:hypothetical protein As57867_017164 [Aphanomyces stellatus]VFT93980.1 Aste57867_17223 [Aphanomyces stellatus]
MCKDVSNLTTQRTRKTRKLDVENSPGPTATSIPGPHSRSNTTKPYNTNSYLVFIDGTAYCADLYNSKFGFVPQSVHDRIECNVLGFLVDNKRLMCESVLLPFWSVV